MLRPLFLLLTIFFTPPLYAQNLVPNFGFELYSDCPSVADQVDYCDGWNKYSGIFTTPDYYNACSPYYYSVPSNQAQFQIDHRNCAAYMGVVTWDSFTSDYREHIGVQLVQPLSIGVEYFLSFYTVMGGQISGGEQYDNPSNNIGMRLSTVSFSQNNPTPIDNFAHLNLPSILSDTANWIRVSGSIVADSAYQYLILGNFYDDANTDTTMLSCGTCMNWYSYYLIDDVCVSTDSSLCNGGIDALPCAVSVEESSRRSQFLFYPNPVHDFITIQNRDDIPFNLDVFNSYGNLLYEEHNIVSGYFQLDVRSYQTGLVFIRIETINQEVIEYKLIKQ